MVDVGASRRFVMEKREAPRVSVATISDLTPGMSSVIFRLESDHWVVLKQKTGRTEFVSGFCGSRCAKVSKPWKLCATSETCLPEPMRPSWYPPETYLAPFIIAIPRII